MNLGRVLPGAIVQAGHRAVPVELVSAHHDWLDYVAALGGVTGALAAIVALVFAWRSARDASGSAASAAESLDIMRKEWEDARQERAKRAKLGLGLEVGRTEGLSDDAPPERVILKLLAWNKGNRPAEEVVLNVAVPKSLDIQANTGETGKPVRIERGEDVTGYGADEQVWMHELGRITTVRRLVRLVQLHRPGAGEYRLVTRIFDLDDAVSHTWRLIIPETGGDVGLEKID